MKSSDSRKMAEEISRLSKAVEDLQRAPRLANSSIDNGSMEVRDEDGTVRTIIGQQDDGSFTVVDRNGGTPPTPQQPVVYDHQPGILTINHYGLADDGAPWPLDTKRVEVHVSTSTPVEPSVTTLAATFEINGGGQVSIALDAGDYYVAAFAVNTSGVRSVSSPEVAATVRAPITVAGRLTYVSPSEPVGLTAEDEGAIWYDVNRGNLLHTWNGSQWVTMTVGTEAVDIGAITPERMNVASGAALYNVVPDPRFLDDNMNAWRLEQMGSTWQFATVTNLLSGDPADYTLIGKTEQIYFEMFAPTQRPTGHACYVETDYTVMWTPGEDVFSTEVFFDPSVDISVYVDGIDARIEYLDGASTVLASVNVASNHDAHTHLPQSGVPVNTVKLRFVGVMPSETDGQIFEMLLWRNPGEIVQPGQGFFFSEELSPEPFDLVRDVSIPPDTPLKGAIRVFHRGVDSGINLGRVTLESYNPEDLDSGSAFLVSDTYDYEWGAQVDVQADHIWMEGTRVRLTLDPFSVNERVEVYGGFLRADPVDAVLYGLTYADTLVVQENFIAPGDTDWIPLPGINGWVWFGSTWETPAYRKLNGIVHLRGLITGGAAGTAFCVLPPGYRASGDRHFPVAAGGTSGIVNVMADGTIKHNSGPTVWVSLDGITYPADG